jgi:hypothetical protein
MPSRLRLKVICRKDGAASIAATMAGAANGRRGWCVVSAEPPFDTPAAINASERAGHWA